MTKIAPSKENKYESKPIMVKKEKIRGRLKDTTDDLAVRSLDKLKAKSFSGKMWKRQLELLKHRNIETGVNSFVFFKSARVSHGADLHLF